MKTKLYILLGILIILAYFLGPLFFKEAKKQIVKKESHAIKSKIFFKKAIQKKVEYNLEKRVKENFIEIENLKILTTDLRKKLNKSKNKNLVPQILWYFFQLEDQIEDKLDFKKSLFRLKVLTKKDKFLQGKLIELEKKITVNFIGRKQFLKNFNDKIPQLIHNNNKKDGLVSKGKAVIGKYISIRKIKFSKDDLKSDEFLIFKIEEAVKNQNYTIAMEFLEKLQPSQKNIIKQEIEQLKKLNIINKILIEVRFYLKDFLTNF